MEENNNVCIAGAACYAPPDSLEVSGLLHKESDSIALANQTPADLALLGIQKVPVTREKSSELAYKAAMGAMENANIKPEEIDVIVDYTTLPEDYVVPSWSMSNKLQADLGAGNAFTLGFSGNGSTTLMVALDSTASLIRSDRHIRTALLFAGERTVAGRHLPQSSEIATVCGDGASAVVLRQSSSDHQRILGSRLWSEGKMHDVLQIPAGGYIEPLNYENYRLRFNTQGWDDYFSRQGQEVFNRLSGELLSPLGIGMDQIRHIICPNISLKERQRVIDLLNLNDNQLIHDNLNSYGHIQSTDLVINYLSAISSGQIAPGDYILFFSHGFGFTWGITLVKF